MFLHYEPFKHELYSNVWISNPHLSITGRSASVRTYLARSLSCLATSLPRFLFSVSKSWVRNMMLYTSIQYHWTLTCSRIFIVPITLMRSHWDFFLAEFNRAWKWECLFWNEAEILESVLKIKNSDFGRPCRNADLPATAISYEFICSWRNTSTSRTGFFLSQLFTVNEKFNPINERLFNVGRNSKKEHFENQNLFKEYNSSFMHKQSSGTYVHIIHFRGVLVSGGQRQRICFAR